MRVALSFLLAVAISAPVALGLQKRFENIDEEKAARLWIEEIAHYIILGHERDAWKRLSSSEERVNFIWAFWRRRDPTPETP